MDDGPPCDLGRWESKPDLDWNLRYWNSEYGWPEHGEEWSRHWGNSAVQWWGTIFPRICGFLPARTLVEIAPGQGRWTRFLLNMCEDYAGFDLSINTTEFCSRYLGEVGRARSRRFSTNSGRDLPGVRNASVDFVFSLNSLVHVEMDVIHAYLGEIARVLRPDGHAFLHHSNLGMYGITGDRNVHCRGETVSAEAVRHACKDLGLRVTVQEMVSWHTEICQDCFTTVTPANGSRPTDPIVIYNDQFWDEAARTGEVLGPYHRTPANG